MTYYYISNWTKDITGFPHIMKAKKMKFSGLNPTIWNPLNGQMVISVQRISLKVCAVHCPLKPVFRSSLGALQGFPWTLADEKWLTVHRQTYTRFTGAPSVSFIHMRGFKAQAKHYSVSGEGVEQWPYVELGAAAGGSIGEYFISAWVKFFPNENIFPWRWGSTICACLLI